MSPASFSASPPPPAFFHYSWEWVGDTVRAARDERPYRRHVVSGGAADDDSRTAPPAKFRAAKDEAGGAHPVPFRLENNKIYIKTEVGAVGIKGIWV